MEDPGVFFGLGEALVLRDDLSREKMVTMVGAWQCYFGIDILAVMFRQYYFGSAILAVLLWQCCYGSAVMAVLFVQATLVVLFLQCHFVSAM